MILAWDDTAKKVASKPRASGDDPEHFWYNEIAHE